MWQKMPKRMLEKCAEALALRKAFPKQLHGIYVREEMAQAGREDEAPKPKVNAKPLPPSLDTTKPVMGPITLQFESTDDPEKDTLVDECMKIINRALSERVITPKDVRNFKKTYLGEEDADPTKCDKAALSDLRKYLAARFEKASAK